MIPTICGGDIVSVTPEERDAMQRLLEVMEGKAPSVPSPKAEQYGAPDTELAGAGQVTQRDIDAMSQVLAKLNNVTQQVVYESEQDPHLRNAINTERNDDGVKVGSYQIMIKEDEKRLAGKQYYSIYHTKTNDIIADDLTLYETALTIVKILNSGRYVNDPVVRKLFEADDRYTSHRTDAIRFKARMKQAENRGDDAKRDVYESRYQVAIDNAMGFKKDIKKLISESRS